MLPTRSKELTQAYEEAFEHHIYMEFEKLVFKHGAAEVLKNLGDETVHALYWGMRENG